MEGVCQAGVSCCTHVVVVGAKSDQDQDRQDDDANPALPALKPDEADWYLEHCVLLQAQRPR